MTEIIVVIEKWTKLGTIRKVPNLFRPCLFTNQQLLENHLALCNVQGAQKIKMPEDEWIHFKDTKKMLKMPLLYMLILKVLQK